MLFEIISHYTAFSKAYDFDLVELNDYDVVKEYRQGIFSMREKALICNTNFDATKTPSFIMTHPLSNPSTMRMELYSLGTRNLITGAHEPYDGKDLEPIPVIKISDLKAIAQEITGQVCPVISIQTLTKISNIDDYAKLHKMMLVNCIGRPYFGVIIIKNGKKIKVESPLYKNLKKVVYDINNDIVYRTTLPTLRQKYWILRSILAVHDERILGVICPQWGQQLDILRKFLDQMIIDIAAVMGSLQPLESDTPYIRIIKDMVLTYFGRINREIVKNKGGQPEETFIRETFLDRKNLRTILDVYKEFTRT